MSARFYTDMALGAGLSISLPEQAARHVQVLRLQPGDGITLFNGQGAEGEFGATIERMGRSDVQVRVGAFSATQREATHPCHLAVGMPANERMDWLVEKATELGVASIYPLMTERSVLRLKGDRLEKKAAHWRGIAAAACEQCGRNRVPVVHAPATLAQWLKANAAPVDADTGADTDAALASNAQGSKLLLSLHPGARPLAQALDGARPSPAASFTFLSGPEGGLSPAEEAAALAAGFKPVTLGARVLRAETAALAVLSFLGLMPDS